MPVPSQDAENSGTVVSGVSITVGVTHSAKVQVYALATVTNAITSVTIGGVAMTRLGSLSLSGSVVAELWFAYRSAAATESVVVNTGTLSAFVVNVVCVLNGNTEAPYYEGYVYQTGTTGNPSLTIPAGSSSRLCLMAVGSYRSGFYGPTFTPGTGQTEINDTGGIVSPIGGELNREANDSATVMDGTLITYDTFAAFALAVVSETADQVTIIMGPRTRQPFLRMFQIHAWTKDFVIPNQSYVRLTLTKGTGTPEFYIRMADNRDVAGDYLAPSNIGKGILNTIHIWELADGRYEPQMFGLIETTRKGGSGPFGEEFEISGRQFGSALADYYANGTAYGVRDWGDIIANPTDGLMTKIPQVGVEGVDYPGVIASAGYNPGAATSIESSLYYAAGMCGTPTEQWRAYFCGSIHGEAKRDTLHFEKVTHYLSPYILSFREALDVSEVAPQIPWEAQQHAEFGETTKYQIGTAVVQYGSAGAVRVRGSNPPVRYFQLAYTSTSAEADVFGDQMIGMRGGNLQLQNIRLWGSMRFEPSNNVLYEPSLDRRILMTIDEVTKHRWPQGALDDVNLSARVAA